LVRTTSTSEENKAVSDQDAEEESAYQHQQLEHLSTRDGDVLLQGLGELPRCAAQRLAKEEKEAPSDESQASKHDGQEISHHHLAKGGRYWHEASQAREGHEVHGDGSDQPPNLGQDGRPTYFEEGYDREELKVLEVLGQRGPPG